MITKYVINIKFRTYEDGIKAEDLMEAIIEEDNLRQWSHDEVFMIYFGIGSWGAAHLMDTLHDVFAAVDCIINVTYKDEDGVTRMMVFDNGEVQSFHANTTWTLEETYPWPPCEE